MDVQHPVETAYVRPENTAGAKTCNRKRDKQALHFLAASRPVCGSHLSEEDTAELKVNEEIIRSLPRTIHDEIQVSK